jgi:orotate phosphoribosyltransferase
MEEKHILQLLRKSDALLDGHFLLSSGKHSSQSVQCAMICQHPDQCAELCAALAERLKGMEIDAVIAPAIGALLMGYELARALGVRSIFMERPDGKKFVLRRGFTIQPGEKLLVAEDVITTGRSVKEIIQEVRTMHAEVVGVASIVDRSAGAAEFEAPLESCVKLDIPAYDVDSCPLCRDGTPAVKPGSRAV